MRIRRRYVRRQFLRYNSPSLLMFALALLGGLIALLPIAALAQATSAAPATVPFSSSGGFAALIIATLGPVAMTAIAHFTGVLPGLVAWLETRTNVSGHEEINAIKNRAFDLIERLVFMGFATATPDIQAIFAAGVTTPEAKAQLEKMKTDLIAQFRAHASPEGLTDDLLHVVFNGDPNGLQQFLEHIFAVSMMKVTGMMKPRPPPPSAIRTAPAGLDKVVRAQ